MEASRLVALLHLSSPALPIGGFSYSQGFEAAAELRLVSDEPTAEQWIIDQLELVIAQCEAPMWTLLFDCWSKGNWAGIDYWNTWFNASRETLEMRRETEQMGWSLARLATDLNWGTVQAQSHLLGQESITLPTSHSYCIQALGIGKHAGLAAYVFLWLENQVAAAIKTIPLGQMAGQRILDRVRPRIPAVVEQALSRAGGVPPELRTLAPQFSILSSRHETQYSRLFRS